MRNGLLVLPAGTPILCTIPTKEVQPVNTSLSCATDVPTPTLASTHYQLREYYMSAEGMRYHIVKSYDEKPTVKVLENTLARFSTDFSAADLDRLRRGGKRSTIYEKGYYRVLAVRDENVIGYGCAS